MENLAKSKKLIPYNYINDQFYKQIFPLPYSNSIYDISSDIELKKLNEIFEKSSENKLAINENISTIETEISGEKIIKQIDFDIKPNLITDKSPFKSAYLMFSFKFPKGLDNLINAYLIDSYLELIIRKELLYTHDIVYRFDSEVICHYFGILVNIILSGFDIGNQEIITQVKDLIDTKPKLPFQYVKNRALGKIYLKCDYQSIKSRLNSHLYIHDFNLDKLISGINQSKVVNLPKSGEMFGLLIN